MSEKMPSPEQIDQSPDSDSRETDHDATNEDAFEFMGVRERSRLSEVYDMVKREKIKREKIKKKIKKSA